MTEPQFSESSPDVTPVEVPTQRRGRPRSQETLARDERVLEALRDGASKTREQLAAELGDKPSLVYLALWRLNRQGRVEKVPDGDVRHGWHLVS